MTYDDLLLLPEDGLRHEIIDGEHYVNASPVTKHQRVSIRLIVEISFYLREHPVGELFHAPLDIVFSRYDVVEPDLLYVSNERREIITTKNIQGSPDLLVEILSARTANTTKSPNARCMSGRKSASTGSWILTTTRFESSDVTRQADMRSPPTCRATTRSPHRCSRRSRSR